MLERLPPSSASLWGCELKWCFWLHHVIRFLSASLWGCELKFCWYSASMTVNCQPPCEAVSWNEQLTIQKDIRWSQPPCEAVSWNMRQLPTVLYKNCQPPCEAVSWNAVSTQSQFTHAVSLLVRLWVEISSVPSIHGTTVRQPPCEAVSWNNDSETNVYTLDCQPPCEAVSWNRRK